MFIDPVQKRQVCVSKVAVLSAKKLLFIGYIKKMNKIFLEKIDKVIRCYRKYIKIIHYIDNYLVIRYAFFKEYEVKCFEGVQDRT